MVYFLIFFLLFSVIFEGTLTTLPLVLICLVSLTIIMRNPFIFFLAFLTGLMLDVFALRAIGESSIFLLVFVYLILLYQHKYEINSYPFVFIASFLGSIAYLLLFGYSSPFMQSAVCAVIAILLFAIVRIKNATQRIIM